MKIHVSHAVEPFGIRARNVKSSRNETVLSLPPPAPPAGPVLGQPVGNREGFMREMMGQFELIQTQNREAMMHGIRGAMQGVATQAEVERQRREMIDAFGRALQPLQTGNQQMVAAPHCMMLMPYGRM